MRYATWQLHFENTRYGTGPEALAYASNATIEGAHLLGQAKGGTIVGYFEGLDSFDELSQWNFQEVTSQEALDLVLTTYPTAKMTADGKITVSIQGE